jgi:hypothetical protein
MGGGGGWASIKGAFLAGAAWQRERDIQICHDIELRGFIDKVPQPGALSVRSAIEDMTDTHVK